ncbi:MAG: tetratricopeptide repeat protein [Vicingaceae bacterium]|nr:tetratricopeptide repeat protein [Vicingaceae bacterium]
MKKLLFLNFLLILASSIFANQTDSSKWVNRIPNDTSAINAGINYAKKLIESDGDKAKKVFEELNKFTKTKTLKDWNYKVNCEFALVIAFNGNYNEADSICNHSLQHFKRTNNTLWQAKAYGNIGKINLDNVQYYKSLEAYNNSINQYKKTTDKKNKAIVTKQLAYNYYILGNHAKASQLYQKAQAISESIKDSSNIASCYSGLANIYAIQDDPEKALATQYLSLKIFRNINKKNKIIAVLNNVGKTHVQLKQLDKAKQCYYEAIELNEPLNNKMTQSNLYMNLGIIYKKGKDLDSAKIFLNKAEKIATEINNKKLLSSIYHEYAILANYNNDILLSKKFAEKGYSLAVEIDHPKHIFISAGDLYYLYQKLNDPTNALKYYKIKIEARDKVKSESNLKASIRAQEKFDYDNQLALDSLKNLEAKEKIAVLHNAEIKQKNTIVIAIGFGLALVILFAFLIYNRLKITRKQKVVIEEQKHVVEEAHQELEEKNQEIMDSINYAKRIQTAILPPNKIVKEYLQESFIYYKPKDIVAGDFYWLEQKNGKTLFAAADCTGHGVPGAMVSVICNNGLNRSVREYDLTDPGKILDKTREIVIQEFEKSEEEVKDGMDIALCCLEGNKLQYAGAHNPLWIIRKDAEEVEEIKANKQPIGQFDNPEPYTTHSIELKQGDSIYVFSDGYADQFGGEKGKKLKTANFKRLLLSIQKENIDKQKELINTAFEDWKGNLEQLDDVCVIGVRI